MKFIDLLFTNVGNYGLDGSLRSLFISYRNRKIWYLQNVYNDVYSPLDWLGAVVGLPCYYKRKAGLVVTNPNRSFLSALNPEGIIEGVAADAVCKHTFIVSCSRRKYSR